MKKIQLGELVLWTALCTRLYLAPTSLHARQSQSLSVGSSLATMVVEKEADFRTYQLSTNVALRDNVPPDKQIVFSETPDHPTIRTGSLLFDGLYAMAIKESVANSVSEISDNGYDNGSPFQIEAFQTGEFWKYVWTRDLSYSLNLALASLDPARAVQSLLFKSSAVKSSVDGGLQNQIIQDTGSGGSYPVSTDRVVWAMGVQETLKYLSGTGRQEFLEKIYPILCDTIEQDRHLTFDSKDGLYRGEQSFLDWREQTYPAWTKENVIGIAMSETLSVNALNYFLLETAAEYSGLLKRPEDQSKYNAWARALKESINLHFFDLRTGLYRAYLLSEDGNYYTPANRYDLLGESLAIIFGIADQNQADSIIKNYPTGHFGPPVVWPEEKGVPIYHNQAIWPFVTAYWIKAARKANNVAAVDAGIQSLEQSAALNLSNMENYDFVTGQSHVEAGPRKGPVINSRRQLWSVAGYLSMVQSTIFGMETSWDGIRFTPFITAKLRNETFRSTNAIELRDLPYKGTRNLVRVHLPPVDTFFQGACIPDRVELNGKVVAEDFVAADSLQPVNVWEIFLKSPPAGQPAGQLKVANVANDRAIFAPSQPEWKSGGGLTLEAGRVVLNFKHDDVSNAAFNIYRDGELYAAGVKQTTWIDPKSGDYQDTVHSYAVEAVDAWSGNVSHLTQSRSFRLGNQQQVIPAKSMHNNGGNLAGDHFENWGKPGDDLETGDFQVNRKGRYLVRVEFSNGAGPVNSGITCAVKKFEIRNASSKEVAASGYFVMPQSGDWNRWDLSSSVSAALNPADHYVIKISEDQYCRNMSYLSNNARYTAGQGGGDQSSNYVNIANVHLLYSNAGN